MRFAVFIALVIILFGGILLTIPGASAQTTEVAIVGSTPSHALIGRGVTITVSATYELGYARNLGVFIWDMDASDYASGTASSSSPDSCVAAANLGKYANSAACILIPSSSSGSEIVTFSLQLSTPKTYHLEAGSALFDASSNVVTGSLTESTSFYVTASNMLQLDIQTNAVNSVQVEIDGASQPLGVSYVTPGTHTISVPSIVQVDSSTRLMFASWSDGSNVNSRTLNLQDDTTLTATYVTQYALTLTDPAATGSGWYAQGSIAVISAPSSASCPGIMGTLGCTQTFSGWYENGTLVSTSNQASITMNSPQTIDTQWSTNDSMPLGIILLVLIVVSAALFFAFRRKAVPLPPSPTRTAQPQPTTQPLPVDQTSKAVRQFCVNCGTTLPVGSKYCNKCGTQQP